MSTTTDRAAIKTCILRCAAPKATARAKGQAVRRCAEHLQRNGDTEHIAADTAAAARRLGEWLETAGAKP